MTGLQHVVRVDPPIKLRSRHIAQRQRRLAQAAALLLRTLGDLCRPVLADMGRVRGHQHQ
jgi:hypothetical protein